MMTRTSNWWVSSTTLSALLGALFFGCGGSVGDVVGGESHFLAYCSAECDGDFDCISGVCTRGCLLGGSDCQALGEGVECTDQSIEPGEVAVCDLACEDDADCDGLGSDYRCDTGHCRSGSASVSSGGSGGSAGAGGSSGAGGTGGSTGGGGGGGAGCEVLFMQYPLGATGIADPLGCGVCECTDSGLVCTDEACSRGAPDVFMCPEAGEITTDSIDIMAARIEGDILVLQVGHSGGCETHDYGVCFDEAFDTSLPVQGGLHLIHDGHDDACEAYLTSELRFDLGPYAEYYLAGFGGESGEILTNFGSYFFGDLPCDERSTVSEAQMSMAVQQISTACSEDSDCSWVEIEAGCSPEPVCSAIVGTGSEALQQSSANIGADICGDFEADGCERQALPRECFGPLQPLVCQDGQCVAAP